MKQISIGEAIRRKAQAEGLTLKKAAAVIGVSYSTLMRWVTGKTYPAPSQYHVLRCFLTFGSAAAAAHLRIEKLEREKLKRKWINAIVDCWLGDAGLPGEASALPVSHRLEKKARPGHISEEQADVLCCIARYTLALEHAPWLDEIARDCRLDVDAVRRALKALEKAGFVKFRPVHFAITSKGREAALQIETERIRTCAFT